MQKTKSLFPAIVRLPVDSNVSITEEEFYARFSALRPALVSQARGSVGFQDDEDVVGRAFEVAHRAWKCGRYKDPTKLSGPSAFAGWMRHILGDCIVDHHRRMGRRKKYEVLSVDMRTSDGDDLRWAALAAEDDRTALTDIELRHEAKQRAMLADLTDLERVCLNARCEGKKLREIQSDLKARGMLTGASKSAISRQIKSASEKCRSVAPGALSAPDLDRYAWAVGSSASIYRSPTKTGSALAREKHNLSDAGFQQSGASQRR